MQVQQLWRHPVKSMQGERLLSTTFTGTGQEHDRSYGVVDRRSGRVLSGKTVPPLLFGRARVDAGTVVIRLPSGDEFAADDPAGAGILSAWLERDVFVERAAAGLRRAFQIQQAASDGEPSPSAPTRDVLCPPGSFLDEAPVHLVDAAWLRGADVRRFRPTVLVTGTAGDDEPSWVGRTVRLGSAVLEIVEPAGRCAMVQRPQPDLPRDVDLARTLIHEHGNVVGLYARVIAGGPIGLGDPVSIG
jgi:uncharacterized protein YcbX